MGKRKRRLHRPPVAPLSSPDDIPCSSGMKPSYTEKPPNQISTIVEQPRSSAEHIMGSNEQQSVPLSQSHQHHQHHQNPGRSTYMKRSRYRGHHYPRYGLGFNYNTYHAKNNSSYDHHVPFKAGNTWNSESGYNTESRERAFYKQERIRSSNTVMEVVPWDDDNIVCGRCQRLLRQKHTIGGNSLLTSEPSVVAVLVCGHVFHADCLEQVTPPEDASDPPCPLCPESPSNNEAARV